MTPRQQFLARLADRSAVIGIFGLGYVGLPLALRYAEAGFRVLAFDIDSVKVAALNSGRSYIEQIASASIASVRGRMFEATADFSRSKEADALIVCVPTPLNKYREPDLSFVLNTVDALAPHLRPGQMLSLESTTYPGTTDEELKPRIEARGLTVGADVFLCFSPERVDPGNSKYATRTIPKVIGARRRPASKRVSRSMVPSLTKSCRSAQRESLKWPSCSRISIALSISALLTR